MASCECCVARSEPRVTRISRTSAKLEELKKHLHTLPPSRHHTTTRETPLPEYQGEDRSLVLCRSQCQVQLIIHFEHITYLNYNPRRSISSTWVIKGLVDSFSYDYAECIHRNVDLSTEDVQFLQAFRRTFNVMLANNTAEMGLVHHDGKLTLPYRSL